MIDGPRIINVTVGQPSSFVFTTKSLYMGQRVTLDIVGKPVGATFTTTFNYDTGVTIGNLTWTPSSSSVIPNLRYEELFITVIIIITIVAITTIFKLLQLLLL